ncbi:MAG: hypothetical protein U0M06_04615 [Clostridia bacterium]|nr:hypothetical protein [Clostridia bacterium]
MKKTKKALLRYHIFHKRFYFKKGFLFLLLMIPMIGMALGIISGMDSGIVTVCLANEGDDPVASQIILSLMTDRSVIHFEEDTVAGAISSVETGKADAAWIFNKDFSERAEKFTKNQSARNFLVRVVQREDGILQMLSREKLCGALYPYMAERLYIHYVNKEISSNIDPDTLSSYYESIVPEGAELFDFSFADGESGGNSGYLTAPLRGLMSVVTVLCGLAVSMFYRMDSENGIFIGISRSEEPFFAFGYHFSAIFDVGLAMLASLYFAGTFTSVLRELLYLVCFAFVTSLFCMTLEKLFGTLSTLAAVTPLLVIAMIVICPVFFNIVDISALGLIFPPYYYLHVIAGADMLIGMLLYTAALLMVYAVLHVVKRKRA